MHIAPQRDDVAMNASGDLDRSIESRDRPERLAGDDQIAADRDQLAASDAARLEAEGFTTGVRRRSPGNDRERRGDPERSGAPHRVPWLRRLPARTGRRRRTLSNR